MMRGGLLLLAVTSLAYVVRDVGSSSIGSQNGIRLSDGFVKNEGTVEVLMEEMQSDKAIGSVWGRVCVAADREAPIGKVACRQLGYERFAGFLEDPSSLEATGFSDNQRTVMRVETCAGSEKRLQDCKHSVFPECASSDRILAVLCASSESLRFKSLSSNMTHYGVAEAYNGQSWKHVCPDQDSTRDRLCRQMGFLESHSNGDEFFKSKRPFVLPDWKEEDTVCNGSDFSTEGCVSFNSSTSEDECGDIDVSFQCRGPLGRIGRPAVLVTSATSANVTWMPPDARNLQISHYTVAYWRAQDSRNDQGATEFRSVTSTLPGEESVSVVLEGLQPRTQYLVQISANVPQLLLVGEFSEAVQFTTYIAAPPMPRGLMVGSTEGSGPLLQHQVVELPSETEVEVKIWTENEDGSECASFQVAPYQQTIQLQGLLPRTLYFVRMRVKQEFEGVETYGPYSEELVQLVLGRTGNASIEQPEAPTGLVATRPDESTVNLRWAHTGPDSVFGWTCASTGANWTVDGIFADSDLQTDGNSFSTSISVVNLKLECQVFVLDFFGKRHLSSAVSLEEFVAPRPATPSLTVSLQGSKVQLTLADKGGARRRRQGVAVVGNPQLPSSSSSLNVLVVQCSLNPIGEQRSYFWEGPENGNGLFLLEDLPSNVNGNCTAKLISSGVSSEPFHFDFNTSVVAIAELPILNTPVVVDGRLRLSWRVPQGHQPFGDATISKLKIWYSKPSSFSIDPPAILALTPTYYDVPAGEARGRQLHYAVALGNDDGIGPYTEPQVALVPSLGITTTPQNVRFDVMNRSRSHVDVRIGWNRIAGAEGYIVRVDLSNSAGYQETEVAVFLSADFTSSGDYREVDLTLNSSCVTKFSYQVAAFNSESKGDFSLKRTFRETNTGVKECENLGLPAAGGSEEYQLYIYVLIGLVVLVVVLLLASCTVAMCLLYKYCMKTKMQKEEIQTDGEHQINRRGSQTSQSTIRSSMRYVGVKSRKLTADPKPDFDKSEEELTKRPLPIPTESDLEDEEDEEETRVDTLRKSMSPPPMSPPPVMQLDVGYSTIPGSVQEEIRIAASANNLLSASVSQSLLEQGYEFVQSTSTSMLDSRAGLSPTGYNTYSIPRGSRQVRSVTPTEYELPVQSRPHTPADTPGLIHSGVAGGLKSVSAPHALTYDVPPSRGGRPVFVTGATTYQSPRCLSPADTYDIPTRYADNRGTPLSVTTPPPFSPTPFSASDMRSNSGGFKPPVIVTSPSPGQTRPGVPYIKTPDSLYDFPRSNSPATNEFGYDVLPARSKKGVMDMSDNHSSSSPHNTTPSIPPRTLDRNELYENLAPSEISDIVSSINGDMYDVPRSVLADKEEDNPAINAGGVTKNDSGNTPNGSVPGDSLYDVPRTERSPSLASEQFSTEGFEVDASALEWRNGVDWDLPDIQEDGQSTASKDNPLPTTSDPSQSPLQSVKAEHPYSRVKRMKGQDGLGKKITVVDDEPRSLESLQDTSTVGSPQPV